jgi:Uncharacterized protein conserved in bacteria (DUF2330)
MRRLPPVLLAVLAAPFAAAAPAGACGMPLEAMVPAEQALISHAGGREELTLKVVLDTTGPGAALVTPVPGVPDTPSVVEGDVFGYLDEVTAPPAKESGGDDGATAGAAPGGGVDVIGRDIVGDYDIARIASDDPDALSKWLKENGYTPPPGAQPILDGYVRDGWKFVAIKLRKGAKPDGPIKPVRVAFPSRQIVYPMRLDTLDDHDMDLDVYVLADHQVRLGGDPLETEYAGPLSGLGKPPPADVEGLFRAPYLTRLHSVVNPSTLKGDFVFARAATSPTPGDGGDGGDDFPLLVVVLVALPLVAFSLFAVWLVRRRREAPPA